MAETSAFERAARAHIASRGSKGTRDLYAADLDGWLAWCAQRQCDPSRPTLQAATDYRDELKGRLAALTVRRTMSALSSIYEAALGFEQPLVTWNPWKRLPRPPADAFTQTEAVSDSVAAAVIAAAERDDSSAGLCDAAVLRLMHDTGLRVSSVVSIRREDVFRRGDQMVVRVLVKGGRREETEVPEPAAAAVDRWLAIAPPSVFLFPARGGKKHMVTKAVNKRLDTRAREAGVGHVHPHQFRSAFATAGFDAGKALHEVQRAMHHLSPLTTLRYDRGQRGTGVTNAIAEFRKGKGRR